MIKLLLSSGLILLIAAGTIGLRKKITDDKFESSTITQTLDNSHTTAAPGTDATGNIVRVGPVKSIVLKEHDLGGSRQVYVYGVIDEMNSPVIAQRILELGKDDKPIDLIINSPGGSVIDGAEIISAMEASKAPINTICVQICASMAAMIHQYGTNRLMIDRSLIMFHPASGGLQGEVDKMYSRLSTLRDYIGEMELNVAKRSKMSYNDYKFKSGVELWLAAKSAKEANVADNVVYVRGSSASKLYKMLGDMRNGALNRRLPFVITGNTVTSKDGKLYWMSVEAFKMIYGESFGIPQEVTR